MTSRSPRSGGRLPSRRTGSVRSRPFHVGLCQSSVEAGLRGGFQQKWPITTDVCSLGIPSPSRLQATRLSGNWSMLWALKLCLFRSAQAPGYHRGPKPPSVLERGRIEGEGPGHSRFQLSFSRRAETCCCPETTWGPGNGWPVHGTRRVVALAQKLSESPDASSRHSNTFWALEQVLTAAWRVGRGNGLKETLILLLGAGKSEAVHAGGGTWWCVARRGGQ